MRWLLGKGVGENPRPFLKCFLDLSGKGGKDFLRGRLEENFIGNGDMQMRDLDQPFIAGDGAYILAAEQKR